MAIERKESMKVTDVNVEVYRWARQVPIRNGRHTYETSGLNVIKVETDEGITGIGLGRNILVQLGS